MQLDSLKGIFIRERKVKEGRAETGLWRQVLRKRGKGGRGAERERGRSGPPFMRECSCSNVAVAT